MQKRAFAIPNANGREIRYTRPCVRACRFFGFWTAKQLIVYCFLASSLALVAQSPRLAYGEIITYDYTGTVVLAPSTAFGYSVAALTTVQGQFSYDTTTGGTTSGTEGTTAGMTTSYQQSESNGFTAAFGSLEVSASSYQVEVTQGILQPNGSYDDEFTVSFASNTSPAPSDPLIVGGVGESVGLLSIAFLGPSSLFSSSALPTSLSESSFTSTAGRFSQSPSGLIDVFFSVSSLQAVQVVPEPDGRLLSFIGGVLVLAAYRQFSRPRFRQCRG